MMSAFRRSASVALSGLCLGAACTGSERRASDAAAVSPAADGKLFTLMPPAYTGMRFENRLADTRELNVFTYRNYYNGGGVAIGDLTGDSLPEVFLTSNLGGNRLYLNRGSFRFEDITRAAGVGGKRSWATGVTFADVNGDGLLDIYVCYAGLEGGTARANELYVAKGISEKGIPTFAEMAREYGVAHEGYSTHAAFFDYDRDGDLDLYLVNNSYRPVNSFGLENVRHVRNELGGHKLFRNDGSRFEDVSRQAGIYESEVAFGLGVAVSDVNRDGWPDIYVSNDFFERDYLYVNRGNGTFEESLEPRMSYISHFSMGLDVADINNDAWPDIYVTDMLPEDDHRLKTTSNFEPWDVYQAKVKNGYHHQFMRNMLHLNNRNGTFSDVGQLAGVARTDWSWSALIADFDLDGLKDIHVTNGLARDVTSQDYVAFLSSEQTMAAATKGSRVDYMRLVNAMSSTKLPDYVFHNRGDFRFVNEAARWGLDRPSSSHGAAYGDLDGDGALDLVVNNVNDTVFVFRNNARSLTPAHRFLQIDLRGSGKNRFGVGAKVSLHRASDVVFQEMMPSRGFQSSVDYTLTFGVGDVDTIDVVRVEWPSGTASELRSVPTNRRVSIAEARAAESSGSRGTTVGALATQLPVLTERGERVPASGRAGRRSPTALFEDVTAVAALNFSHTENEFVDFDRERLIPKMVSLEGPPMAVGDVNGDGLDDVYIGGAKDQAGRLLVQQPALGARLAAAAATTSRADAAGPLWVPSSAEVFQGDAISEDVGAAFFDANGDRALDLYVVSGGNEFSELAPALQDRLYLNDGRGNFRKTSGHLPAEFTSGSRVVPADYDADGDIDLFVGGRVVPWRYGTDPKSMLLRNDGRGRFTDVTAQVAPELERAGMVTDALWHDVNGDRRPDLVVVGEWMPITVFVNGGGGRLRRAAIKGLERTHGWWNRIIAGDFTGDGRTDFVAGNLGLNTRLTASADEPATMHVKDMDGNGFAEQIISTYNAGVSYPIVLRDDLLKALPHLKSRFPSYKDYAGRRVTDIFTSEELRGAVVKSAHTFATSLLRSTGDGGFAVAPLPREAQFAPVYAMLAGDFDGDRKLDLLLAGNFDGVKPEFGRMSASQGLLLTGSSAGPGGLAAVGAPESGFVVPGQSRDIQRIRTSRGAVIVVIRNNDAPLAFRVSGTR